MEYGHSLIINPALGMDHEIHPYRPMSIDSIKINPGQCIFAVLQYKRESSGLNSSSIEDCHIQAGVEWSTSVYLPQGWR